MSHSFSANANWSLLGPRRTWVRPQRLSAVRIVEADFDAVIDSYLRTLSQTGSVGLSELELATVEVAEAHVAGTLELELL